MKIGYKQLSLKPGYILFNTLVLLSIVSLLAISSLNTAFFEQRMASNFEIGERLFYAAESVLKQAEQKLVVKLDALPCLLIAQGVNAYAQRDNAWWLSTNTCSISILHANARFVVEKLGMDKCVQVKNVAVQGGAYYRITAWVLAASVRMPRVVQSTVVVPDAALPPISCQQIRSVKSGRQSWRKA